MSEVKPDGLVVVLLNNIKDMAEVIYEKHHTSANLFHAIGCGDSDWDDLLEPPAPEKTDTKLLAEIHRKQPDNVFYVEDVDGIVTIGTTETIIANRLDPSANYSGLELIVENGPSIDVSAEINNYSIVSTSIISVDTVSDTFTISGNYAASLAVGYEFQISGTAGGNNDGVFTVQSAVDNGPNTEVVVQEDITIDTGATGTFYVSQTLEFSPSTFPNGFVSGNSFVIKYALASSTPSYAIRIQTTWNDIETFANGDIREEAIFSDATGYVYSATGDFVGTISINDIQITLDSTFYASLSVGDLLGFEDNALGVLEYRRIASKDGSDKITLTAPLLNSYNYSAGDVINTYTLTEGNMINHYRDTKETKTSLDGLLRILIMDFRGQ